MIGTIMRAGGIFFPNENKEKTDGRHKWALRVMAVMRFHSADGRCWDICVNYSTSRVSMSKSLLSQTHTLCTRIYERDRKCQMRITSDTRKEIRNENNIQMDDRAYGGGYNFIISVYIHLHVVVSQSGQQLLNWSWPEVVLLRLRRSLETNPAGRNSKTRAGNSSSGRPFNASTAAALSNVEF